MRQRRRKTRTFLRQYLSEPAATRPAPRPPLAAEATKKTFKYIESTLADLDPKQRSAYLMALQRWTQESFYISMGAYRPRKSARLIDYDGQAEASDWGRDTRTKTCKLPHDAYNRDRFGCRRRTALVQTREGGHSGTDAGACLSRNPGRPRGRSEPRGRTRHGLRPAFGHNGAGHHHNFVSPIPRARSARPSSKHNKRVPGAQAPTSFTYFACSALPTSAPSDCKNLRALLAAQHGPWPVPWTKT